MRQRAYLLERYQLMLGYLGVLWVVMGAVYLLPLFSLFFWPEDLPHALPLGLVAGLLAFSGGGLWHRFLRNAPSREITMPEGAAIVTGAWFTATLTGVIPFLWGGGLGLGFTQAVFESTSAWTSAGLTVVDVTTAPQIMLLYRSTLQLAGGAGLAILALAAVSGPIGYGISQTEGRADKLAPHVRNSASIVLTLYSTYVVLGVVSLYIVGMSPFDAVNHAFTAVATGGFSTRAESIGYWDSAQVEAVIIVLMLLGSVNFLTVYTLLRGKWSAVAHNGELRLYGFLLLFGIALLLVLVTLGLYPTANKAVRVAVFEVVSAISTAGFNTVNYSDWGDFGFLLMIILMLVGGGSGSTAGGLKLSRIYVLYQAIRWEIHRASLPTNAVNEPRLWQGDGFSILTSDQVRSVGLFVGMYVSLVFVGSGVMVAHGYTLSESLFEFTSTLGTVGLSVGVTSPDAPVLILWTQVVAMLLGRLEIFAVFIGLRKMAQDGLEFVALGRKDELSGLRPR